MKLRNKKTGEIIDVYKGQVLIHYDHGRKTIQFKSLKDLEEWEDYEEPKEYWYISDSGRVVNGNAEEETHKQIGNYFETKEDAKKAVEKLNAWKRLKDKGFQPVNCTVEHFGREILVHFIIEQPYDEKDLVLLFGGKQNELN